MRFGIPGTPIRIAWLTISEADFVAYKLEQRFEGRDGCGGDAYADFDGTPVCDVGSGNWRNDVNSDERETA